MVISKGFALFHIGIGVLCNTVGGLLCYGALTKIQTSNNAFGLVLSFGIGIFIFGLLMYVEAFNDSPNYV